MSFLLTALSPITSLLPDVDVHINPFDKPKRTSIDSIASNLCICLCCAFMTGQAVSFPFKTPPIIMCAALSCILTAVTTKNLYDEGVARLKPAPPPQNQQQQA